MTALKWHRPSKKVYQAGLDRGVIYPEDGPAIPWNGLISVNDTGESTLKEFYLDGVKYLSFVSARNWKGSIEAYTYPDEFGELIGMPEIGDGLIADSQMPRQFGLSYRNRVTAPEVTGPQHYQIHLVYQAMAQIGDFSHQTMTADGEDPSSFTFDITAVPQRVPNHRPTAHFVIDTRRIDIVTRGTIEGILYGNGHHDARMPTVQELLNLLRFGDAVTITDNGDSTWTASGSNQNVYMIDEDYFQIDNVDAVYLNEVEYEFQNVQPLPNLAIAQGPSGGPYYEVTE